MRNQRSKQIRLATFGFDQRAQESFRMTFKGPGKNKALLVDDQSADFGIINLDAADSKTLLEEYRRRYPGRPAIKFSVKDLQKSNSLYLKKPARVSDVLAAVDRLIAKLDALQSRARKPGSDNVIVKSMVKDESKNKPAKVKAAKTDDVVLLRRKGRSKQKQSLYFNPKDYIQSQIHSAVDYSNMRLLVVELWLMSDQDSWKKIIFMPRLQKVITSFSDEDLRDFCTLPLSMMNHKLYRRNDRESALIQEKIEQERRGVSYEAFLWKVAILTSQGCLPHGASARKATQLKQWPNLTRLYPVAGSMRIATLMVEHPNSLLVIAKVLKMPLARVFEFYSAASAIGIVDDLNGGADLSKQSFPQRHRDHTLFGRILKRLVRNDEQETEILVQQQ